jgi:ABC-type polysaccharide/polyol phosphate export systems, permease component
MPGLIADPSVDAARAEALAWVARPRRFGAWYFAEHVVRTMGAYKWTIAVGALGQPLLYLLGLGAGLAALIATPVQDGDASVRYLVFVAPALLMTAGISVASEEFSYPVMGGFKWRRLYYGPNASPISSPQIVTAVILAALLRIVIVVVVYFAVLVVFGAVPVLATGWLLIPIGILAALSFGLPFMAYAGSLEKDSGQFALVQRFIFMPMFLFSGTFYPLTNLPIELRWIGWVSPLWHASELGRAVSYAKPIEPWLLVVHLGYLLVLSIGAYVLARRIFTRRLAQ